MKNSPAIATRNLSAGLQRRSQSAIRNPQSAIKSGVALVVTLLMLSVITMVAVAFLALSRRGRSSATQGITLTDARNMSDAGLERGLGQIHALILARTNMLAGDLGVSRNYLNPNGFQPGVADPLNVNYVYANGTPLSPQDFLQNVANLLIDPRAPVFVRTNRPGTPPASEFRFYLDLNRNGQFETNGFFLPYDDVMQAIGTNVFFFVGDPEWIGVLEKPNQPHSANNRFIGRYAYIILPVGKSLDLNFIHNMSQTNQLFGQANPGRFYRDQGFGTYEINLAAFLTALNTNAWSAWRDYYYATNGNCTGIAFFDALELLQYRYAGEYTLNDTVQNIFGPNAPVFTSDRIDGLARAVDIIPPSGFPDDLPQHAWPGASSRQHFYSIHDFFNRSKLSPYTNLVANFTDHLMSVLNRANSHDRYTFYRLLSELSTDTAEEPAHADLFSLKRQMSAVKPEEFLADTVGRINLNYDNINYAASDFQPWDPLFFFTNVANVLLASQHDLFITNITDIPVAPTNQYPHVVHRLLQLAANIYDASTTNPFPSVFLPLIDKNTQRITGYTTNLNRATALQFTLTNDYAVPAVVGAKKGLPNFNEYVFQSAVQITRKLEVGRPNTNSPPNQTNQIMILSISNVFGVESWNSYSKPFSNDFQVYVSNVVSCTLSNADDGTTVSTNIFSGSDFAVLAGTNQNWYFKPRFPTKILADGGFMVPLYTNTVLLPGSRYNGVGFDGATNSFLPRSGNLPTADWRLIVSNRLTYVVSSPPGPGGKVLDIVSFPYQTNLNLTEFLTGQNGATEGDANTVNLLVGLWDTNRFGTPVTLKTPSDGVLLQLGISQGNPNVDDTFWRNYNPETGDKTNSIASFKAFLGTSPSSNLFQQAPFSAARRFVHTVTWQANDPMVHYMPEDLKDHTNNATLRYLKRTDSDVFTNNLGRLNERFRPWNGNPLKDPDPAEAYVGTKDPGVFNSDDWDFPSQKFPSIGWLGRVHRGTPWQTVYLKAEVADPTTWQKQSLDLRTHPTNDWRLLDVFTVAQNPNASHGQLSINQSGLAAWTAVMGSLTVLSNTLASPAKVAPPPSSFANLLLDPAVNAPVIQAIVDGINRKRLQQPNQVFRSLGDLMSVPELTYGTVAGQPVSSPFLDVSSDIARRYGLTDQAYERIPQQILSLLKVGDARYVVYAFGQSLKPADKSIVTSTTDPKFFGMCTNYQITGEVYTRALVKIDRDLSTTNFVLKPKILNFNILPAD